MPQAVGMQEEDVPAWPMSNHEELYERHAEYLRRVVPEGQLHYFDVRDGWEPLCKILEVEVPVEPFPHEFPRSWLISGKADIKSKLRRRFALLVWLFGVGGLVLWRRGIGRWLLSRMRFR